MSFGTEEIAWVIRITEDWSLKQNSDFPEPPCYQTKWAFFNFSRLWQEMLFFKTYSLFHWYECCLLCNCMVFLKVQLQATLSRHDKGSTTLPEGVSTGKQKNGNLRFRADSAIYIWISRQINFIRFGRNLCRGNIFLSPLTQTGLNTIILSRKKSLFLVLIRTGVSGLYS